MKQIILTSILLLTINLVSIAQGNRTYYKKTFKTTKIPLSHPMNQSGNQIVIKNDTVVCPRGGNNIMLVYKLFYNTDAASQYRKGILVMGSGNNETTPTEGSLNGASENALCNKAVQDGYVAAIVRYTAGPGIANWNASAQLLAADFDACLSNISTKFNIPKSNSVAGGVSYAGFMLLTANAYYSTLNYCKGILAPCSATSTDAASKFKVPVYNICCKGGHENGNGNETGSVLYNAINPAVKTKSECIIDNSCQTHCGNNWTNELFQKMQFWLQ
ncbi:MAG: hypothetical protein IT257_02970 [Chitinophagaceae bacterium]|nr:hypothetical protein [Chitinophagaceae bacterium]